MKTAKIPCAVAIAFALTCGCVPAAEAPRDSAEASVLIEADSGDVIFEKNSSKRMGPASTTKIMTALVALENADENAEMIFDARAENTEGSSAYMRAGEKYTLKELLYAMMLQSANDAAACIAYAVGGSIEGFAEMMNGKAKELGLENTHFENPHGLDGEEHFTSAYDLAMIAREALKNETFAGIVSSKTAKIGAGEHTKVFRNHNRLLFEYDDVIGVKTGFTKKCGRTLVSAAERNGVKLICVTLCDGDDWRDHRRLLNAGFELYESVLLCRDGELSFDVHVCGGENATVKVSNDAECRVTLKKGGAAPQMKAELPPFVYADVENGETLGYARFYIDGKETASVALKAQGDVRRR